MGLMLAANFFWVHVLALTIIFQTPVHIFEGVFELIAAFWRFS
jgi:hypothetical protein